MGWLKHINRVTGRIHPSYNLHTTVTGRLSSSGPNAQNLKRDMEDILVAPSGCAIVQADYSQIELRMATYLSQDEWFLDVYTRGGDVHSEKAAQVFGPDFTKEQRVFTKGLNFGLIYGRGVQDILDDPNLPMSRAQAEEFIEEFFDTMPGVLSWIDSVHKFVRETGYVKTVFGRKRMFPLITNRNEDEIYRQAVNTLCQSPASDIMLAALIRLVEMFEDDEEVKVILNIHDSILCECSEHRVMDVGRTMKQVMESTATELMGDQVPFLVEVESGPSKGALKGLEL
jgi:DNA polymerase-1